MPKGYNFYTGEVEVLKLNAKGKLARLWTEIDVSACSAEIKQAAAEYDTINATLNEARDKVSKLVISSLTDLVPKDMTLACGYNWGKVAVCADDTAGKTTTKGKGIAINSPK